ncbi:MAG: hypothetical protein ACI3XX_05875 [Eubacteriales bacterium]
MKYPKIKHALFCRILTYVVILGAAVIPIAIVASLKFIPSTVQVLVILACTCGLIFYLFTNLSVLMCLDIKLATMHCYNTARKYFSLPYGDVQKRAERKISRYGKKCSPLAITPTPENLRYKMKSPVTIYSSGLEKVVAAYHVDFLDKDIYKSILSSAKANSEALRGKKKPLLLSRSQKSSPLNRVTVVFIFAKSVDDMFSHELPNAVCKQSGEGFDESFMMCVIDMHKRICVFDSMRIPYEGFGYPAKNRGFHLVKKFIFNGKISPKKNSALLDKGDIDDPEQSLWSLWHGIRKELILSGKEDEKRFSSMKDKEIVIYEDLIYIKSGERGVSLFVEEDEESKSAKISYIDIWDYPKANQISKSDCDEIKKLITEHFQSVGYKTEFEDINGEYS